MSEQYDDPTFPGPHPTAADLQKHLAAWGFERRGEDGVHLIYRAPGGGRIKLLRSLTGRADLDVAAKAARYLGLSAQQFWAGPDSDTSAATDPEPVSATARRRRSAELHDSIPSLVLAAHTKADRPLGFDEVLDLCGQRVTRAQIRGASSALHRDGQLDRIRSGVYQWAAGTRAARDRPAPATPNLYSVPRQESTPAPAATPPVSGASSAVALFLRLFPAGVRMTPELFADFERWRDLTEKLSNHADVQMSHP